MALHYKNEHLACNMYANEENQIFSVLEFDRGNEVKRRYLHLSLIVIILEGEVEISYGIDKSVRLSSDYMFVLPKNFDITIKSIEYSRLILCQFSNNINLCSRYSINLLEQYVSDTDEVTLFSLKLDKRLRAFAELLYECLTEGIGCLHYHQIKREELFMYLRAGYTKEELALFFKPILGKNMDFKDFILSNYKEVYDVNEFARRANMSLSTFNRRFKETFNDTALRWLLARKSEEILNDILKSTLSLAEISEKYHFSSPSYFTAFCKKFYGKTAQDLRKSRG